MITVTRLNQQRMVINAELIKTIEERPDTTINLTSGDTIIVQEGANEVIAKVVAYGRLLRTAMPPS